ncbi:hypothetical protein ACFE04_009232 [Oxalis oulophora]
MAKVSVLFCFIIFFSFGFVINGSFFEDKSKSHKVGVYELKKGNFSIKLTNWGATIMSVVLPDKYGELGDIVLGFDSPKDYKNDSVYFGATVGRVANRIGGAKFTLNGITYKLVANEGKNMLHGGPKGFSDVLWKVKKYKKDGHSPHLVFGYKSCDGEEGFPGDLSVTVSYRIIRDTHLSIIMKAKALDKPTPVNLAQHSYWNLGNHNSGNILSEEVQIFASKYTPVDKDLIPTGKLESVKGTPFDFLEPHTVGSTISKLPNGYDINYVVDDENGHKVKKVAVVHDKKTGRVMELFANQPGVQFYTGNYLKDVKGKDGVVYKAHAGLCLETQDFPDAVNHPSFPSSIVYPGKTYKHFMLYKFSISK